MASHQEHLVAGMASYGLYAVAGAGLWFVRQQPYLGWTRHLLPVSEMRLETVLGVGFCFVVVALAALWPDVDIKSVGQLIFYRVFFAADVALLMLFYTRHNLRYLEGAAFLGFVAMLPLVGKHRGWTHTRLAMLLVPAPILLAPMILARQVTWEGLPYFLAAFLGYASHLYEDGILFRR